MQKLPYDIRSPAWMRSGSHETKPDVFYSDVDMTLHNAERYLQ